MQTVELMIEQDIDMDEFRKVIGFVSEKIKGYECQQNKIILSIDDPDCADSIADEIKQLASKYVSNKGIEKILFSGSAKKNMFFNQFRTIHYFDDGMISLSKQSKFLFEYFNSLFEQMVLSCFSNEACDLITKIYPVLLPVNAYKKTGYLKRTPQYAIFCCSLCEDFRILNQFNDLPVNEYSKVLKTPDYALSPSACFHVYEEYKDQELPRNTVVTFTQSVFRNEGRFNFSEYGRMRDYHVREIVFIGDEEFVESSRTKILELTKKLVEDTQIAATITIASDPFVLPRMQKFKKMQVIDNSKYELRFPYQDSHDMSVASFNLHGTAFTQPFNISVKDKDTVTGCIGFGIERFVLSFLSQYSEDEEKWPENIRMEYLGKYDS